MKHTRLLLAFAGGLTLALALLVVLNPNTVMAAPAPEIRYVLSAGFNSSDCTDPNTPCKTIQYAIGQAKSGDIIQVANQTTPAVYAGPMSINKTVNLQGGWAAVAFPGGYLWRRPTPCEASRTTIDASGAGRVISITGDIKPIIDCFTITGGDADGLGGDPDGPNAGGGIYSDGAAPIIINNVITGNYGCDFCSTSYGRGGGIYLLDAPATAVVSNNLIANNVGANTTLGWGGGVMLRDSQAQVLGNTIQSNRSGIVGDGGGIMIVGGSPTIADNTILQNEAGSHVLCLGGGVFVWSSTVVTIEHNLIQYNRAIADSGVITMTSKGGGIYYSGNPTGVAIIRDNVIRGNGASPKGPQSGAGGGIYLTHLIAPSEVSGNLIADNVGGFNTNGDGGGIYVDQSVVDIVGNDLIDNSATWAGGQGKGGGLYINGGSVLIASNVISSNHGAGFTGSPSTSTGYGGGMAISGSLASVIDNQIVNNTGTNAENWGVGGGIYGFGGTLHIEKNTIAGNRASIDDLGLGGGVYLDDASPTLKSNVIVDNAASGGTSGRGGGVRIYWSPTFTMTNNLIARNAASEWGSGIAIAQDSVGTLAHNTIAENAGGDGSGVYVQFSSDVTLYNNIVVSHTTGILVADPGTSTVNASYTLFEANTTNYGAGVSSSFEIAGPAALLSNYHLKGSSNAINHGTLLAWVTDDIDGDPRIYGAAPDVGADEVTCLARVGGATYTSIQAAVNAATSGQTIQVAKGICYENVSIAKSVTLEGGWDIAFTVRDAAPATVSTIDGLGAGRAISITEVSGSIAVTIDGFTITGGDATGLNGSGMGYDVGGGIYSYYADTTIIACTITGNLASASTIGWGGGVGLYGGNVTLQGNTIQSNTASTAGNGYGGGVYLRSTTSAAVNGNTIQGNLASADGRGHGGGLGMHFGNAALQGNTIYNNVATSSDDGFGGGVYVYASTASLNGDVVRGNRAAAIGTSSQGGGVSAHNNTHLTVTGAEIYGNVATSGGGVYIQDSDSAVLSDTLIYENKAGLGGGVYVTASDDALLTGNQVYANGADYGGGIYLNSSADATLTGNYIHNNGAVGLGGGLWLSGCGNAILVNNIIVENRLTGSDNGAGVFLLGSTVHFVHTTLARNSGGDGEGLYLSDSSQAWLTNTIVASHTVGVYVNSGCAATLETTLWGNGAWANTADKGGSGTIVDLAAIAGDPAFVDPDGTNPDGLDDYYIGLTSAARDTGLYAGVTTDIAGDPRPIGPAVDIGADEAWGATFLPLVLRNYP